MTPHPLHSTPLTPSSLARSLIELGTTERARYIGRRGVAPPTFCTPVESELALTKAGGAKFCMFYTCTVSTVHVHAFPPLGLCHLSPYFYLNRVCNPSPIGVHNGLRLLARMLNTPGLIIPAPPFGAWAECAAVASPLSFRILLAPHSTDCDEVANF